MLAACRNSQGKVKIVYQDQLFTLLDKSGNLVVLRGSTVRGLILQDWVEKNLGVEATE